LGFGNGQRFSSTRGSQYDDILLEIIELLLWRPEVKFIADTTCFHGSPEYVWILSPQFIQEFCAPPGSFLTTNIAFNLSRAPALELGQAGRGSPSLPGGL